MIIKETTPSIRQWKYTQEKEDEDYGSCTWAEFNLDCDNYTLMISSDCGAYTYSWCVTPSESFIKLMSRINDSYLLEKISSKSIFDIDQSIDSTVKSLHDLYDDEEIYNGTSIDDVCQEIKDISECYDYRTEESFYIETERILDSYKIQDAFEIINCVKHYPAGAKRIVNIFCNVLQPILMKDGVPTTTYERTKGVPDDSED